MRHQVDGRKFGRNTSHRVAMFRNLAANVLRHEQIETTVEKAKEARRIVDRLITLGKQGTTHARRIAFSRLGDGEMVEKLFTTLAQRYASRAGGYTRVLKMSQRRWGDAAETAILELVDHGVLPLVGKAAKASKGPKAKKEKAETKVKAPKAAKAKAEAAEAAPVDAEGTKAADGDSSKKESFKGIKKLFGGGKGGKKGTGVKAGPTVNKRSGSRGGGE